MNHADETVHNLNELCNTTEQDRRHAAFRLTFSTITPPPGCIAIEEYSTLLEMWMQQNTRIDRLEDALRDGVIYLEAKRDHSEITANEIMLLDEFQGVLDGGECENEPNVLKDLSRGIDDDHI